MNDMQQSRNNTSDKEEMRNVEATYSKHIVAAMGRIGLSKLKVRDNNGALAMFEGILNELKDDKKDGSGNTSNSNSNSAAMRLETARAHIKHATVY